MSETFRESSLLSARLRNDKPFLLARLGATEAGIVGEYLGERPRFAIALRQTAWNNAGVFPPTRKTLEFFSKRYLEAVVASNMVATWPDGTLANQKNILNLNPSAQRIKASTLDAVQLAAELPTSNVWTQSLAGQRVLVVHSMSETIARQALNLKSLHVKNILPDFDVFTLKPPQTQGFQFLSGGYQANLESTSRSLERCISDNNIDVVLLAAGAYGLPLALEAFKHGTKALYIGGSLQLLFGINGNRWLGNPQVESMKTPLWVERSSEGRPLGAKLVEGSTYW